MVVFLQGEDNTQIVFDASFIFTNGGDYISAALQHSRLKAAKLRANVEQKADPTI
jgi:hypothetical protein